MHSPAQQCSAQVFKRQGVNLKKGISVAFGDKKGLTTVVCAFFSNILMITVCDGHLFVYLPYNRLQVNAKLLMYFW